VVLQELLDKLDELLICLNEGNTIRHRFFSILLHQDLGLLRAMHQSAGRCLLISYLNEQMFFFYIIEGMVGSSMLLNHAVLVVQKQSTFQYMKKIDFK
jgi:hypothetical protein